MLNKMLNKLLDLKVPTMFADHSQGTLKTEWQAYLFMLVLLLTPILVLVTYFNYWI